KRLRTHSRAAGLTIRRFNATKQAEFGIARTEAVFIIELMAMRPVGTVTFLFTDMEGSTRAWEAHPKETRAALQRHDEIVARAIEANRGTIILERGEGDSVFAVFERASDAVAAACELQLALGKEEWPSEVPLRVRVGIHTGEADADYRGAHVNRAARSRADWLRRERQDAIGDPSRGRRARKIPGRGTFCRSCAIE